MYAPDELAAVVAGASFELEIPAYEGAPAGEERDFAVQGELLAFWLLVRRKAEPPKGRMPDLLDALRRVNFEVRVVEYVNPGEIRGSLEEKPKDWLDAATLTATNLPPSVLATTSFVQFARGVPSMSVPRAAPVAAAAVPPKPGAPAAAAPPPAIEQLPSGDVRVHLSAVLSVKPEFLGRSVTLVVCMTPPAPSAAAPGRRVQEVIRRICTESASVPSQLSRRYARRNLRVVQPLQVHTEGRPAGEAVYVQARVQNGHPTLALRLHDVQLHLASSVDVAPAPAGAAPRALTATMEPEDFPLELLPGEEHSFVACVAPAAAAPPAEPSAGPAGEIIAPLSIAYTPLFDCAAHAAASGRSPPVNVFARASADPPLRPLSKSHQVLTTFPVRLRPPQASPLVVAFECRSPVPLHSVFTASLTVTNASSRPVNLSLSLEPPQEFRTHPSTPVSATAVGASGRSISEAGPSSGSASRLPALASGPPESGAALRRSASSDAIAVGARRGSWGMGRQGSHPSLGALAGGPAHAEHGDREGEHWGVVCLHRTLAIGALAPRQCRRVELQLLALRGGTYEIGRMTFRDRAAPATSDFRLRAPCVVAVAASA
eukprot:tig00021127_g18801.t1